MIHRVLAFSLLAAGLCAAHTSAQRSFSPSGWVIGGGAGLMSGPPISFAPNAYYAPAEGPYDHSVCRPGALISLGVMGARSFRDWLRTDLLLEGHVEGGCLIASTGESNEPYANVRYLQPAHGYSHWSALLRGVFEHSSHPLQPRLIAGVGCICAKRVPIAQLGAGFNVGSQQNRLAIEAGGQISRVAWSRHIEIYYFPTNSVLREWSESGTNFPAQLWFRLGFERLVGRN